MKLTLDQLPGFIQSTLAAINEGAWNARETDGVFVEFGEGKVNFEVELVQTLNGITRTNLTSPNAPKVTVTLQSGSTETTSDTGRTTTGTETTTTSSKTTPAGRTSTVTSAPEHSLETTTPNSTQTTQQANGGSDANDEYFTWESFA